MTTAVAVPSTLATLIESERNSKFKPISASSKLRKQMLAGEAVMSSGDEYTSALFHQTKRSMKALGFKFRTKNIGGKGGRLSYRITNPTHQPTARNLTAARKVAQSGRTNPIRRVAVTRAAPVVQQVPITVTAVPNLGASLRVTGLREVGKNIEITLQNGTKAWNVTVASEAVSS